MTGDQHMTTASCKGGDSGRVNVHQGVLGMPRLVLPVHWCFPKFSSLVRALSGTWNKARTSLLGLDCRSSHGAYEVNKALRTSGSRSWHGQEH